LIWHGITHHVIIQNISFFSFLMDHGVMYCFFVMITCCEKITCHEKNIIIIFCQQKGFDIICHDVHVCKLICMKYINAHINQGTSSKHTKVLTAKPLHNFINKEEKFNFVVFSMKLFRKLKIKNLCFLFQNLFKCYKWKHNIEDYSIIYCYNFIILNFKFKG